MCPGIETTWKIQPFQITSSGAESDAEGEWERSEERPDQEAGEGTGGLAEISLMLAEARKAATQQVWPMEVTDHSHLCCVCMHLCHDCVIAVHVNIVRTCTEGIVYVLVV